MSVNQYERAFRTWPFLTTRASQRSKVTYTELAEHLGIHPRPLRYVLAVIQDWCLHEHKPPLTILVVNQSRGQPGQGFIAWDATRLDEGYEEVFAYPWLTLPNPFQFAAQDSTPAELARAVINNPHDAGEVYRKVRDRGIAQVIFRLALLDAYRQQCAFCGLSLKAALQAAHIIPWNDANAEQRISPVNGLLLCSTHHALFDNGILGISIDRRIVCHHAKVPSQRWTDADKRIAADLHGQDVRLPVDVRLWPSDDVLAYQGKSH
ncbi:HNH endonuclease [Actinomadura sp. WAC 06369]|uniref:HNH endonuclease n=1 Tax=Actinomadura sp. WAC 06369 TaxID=2203193 RepID=UPI0013151052|nr:HNH endonuclease [Actinomadura sp. WAC 06369]